MQNRLEELRGLTEKHRAESDKLERLGELGESDEFIMPLAGCVEKLLNAILDFRDEPSPSEKLRAGYLLMLMDKGEQLQEAQFRRFLRSLS